MSIISNLLRLIAKPIFLKLGKGLKSSKTQYCLGDELDIRLDDSIVGKDNVIAKPPTRTNSFARWKDSVGKELTDSKTIQDNDGNIQTETSFDGKLTDSYRNNAIGANNDAIREVAVGGGAGVPVLRINRVRTQVWDQYCDRGDKSFKIHGESKENPTQMGNFFRIGRDGNNTHPFQYSAFAILSENTGNINSGATYYFGQGTPLTIVDNEGKNFFPGAGNNPSRPAMFTCKEAAKYLVYVSAVVNQNDPRADCEIQAAFSVETKQGTKRNTGAINIIPKAFRKNTATVLGGVKAEAGDTIKFYIYSVTPGTNWFIERTIGATYTTYVGVYCLG